MYPKCKRTKQGTEMDNKQHRLRQCGPVADRYKPTVALKYIRSQLADVTLIRKPRFSESKKVKSLKSEHEIKNTSLSRNHHGYNFSKKIGEGGCAFVYKVVSKDEKKDAESSPRVAKVSKRPIHEQCYQERESWIAEVDILSTINHRNIVRCFECFHLRGHTVLVMEYVDGGDLFELIVASDSVHVNSRSVICQTLEALDYLHGKQRIAHMDLKVENILVNNKGLVKICDFGSAVRVPDSGLVRAHGITTPSILPPEYFQCDLCDPMACDVWSVGVIMYLLLIQKYPYGNGDPVPIKMEDYRKSLDFSAVDFHEFQTLIMLIRQCLEKEPTNRITAQEALKAEFFKL